jgi:recombination protein RecT
MTDTNVVAADKKSSHPIVAFNQQLDERESELRAALPSHIPVDRFKRVAKTAVTMNTDLLTVNRQSLFLALMRAAQDGLLPDGRQGVIVAYNDHNERSPTKGQQIAQWQPMIAGLLLRFRNSGQFKSVSAEIVREGEQFRHWIDEAGEHLLHEPGDGTGKPVKAYALALTKDGGAMIKVMSVADIEKRRAVSRAKNGPMWVQWWDEAALKTVLRNLHKRLPTSSDLDEMMYRDDEVEGDPFVPPLAQRAPGVAAALEQFGTAEPQAEKTPVEDDKDRTSAAQEKKGRPQ